jgi:hypothetical protein
MLVTPWALGALISASVLFWCLWRRRDITGSRALMLSTLVSSYWLLTYAFQLDGQDVETALMWRKIKYFGIAFAGTCWVVFALQYAGFGRILTRSSMALLLVIPCAMLALTLTNGAHGLMWEGTPTTAHEVGIMPYGPAFSGFVACTYLSLLVASAALVWTLMRSGRLYWRQTVVLLSAIGLPWGASVLETGLILPIGHWVLRQACRDIRRWQMSDPAYAWLSVAVNSQRGSSKTSSWWSLSLSCWPSTRWTRLPSRWRSPRAWRCRTPRRPLPGWRRSKSWGSTSPLTILGRATPA